MKEDLFSGGIMQDKNINGQNNFDSTQEELIDITSEGAGFIAPGDSDDEKTDINEVRSDLNINDVNSRRFSDDIQIVEDFNRLSQDDDNQRNRYAHSQKENFFSKHKIPLIISGAAVLVVAVVGVVLWQLVSNGIIQNPFEETVGPIVNDEGEFAYLDGIQVSGIDISGKTYEEAKKLLEDSEDKYIKSFTLSVKANDNSYEFTSEDFTYTYNIEEILDKAKKYCEDAHAGEIDVTEPATDASGNYKDMYTVTATVVDDSIGTIAEKIAKDTDTQATNARVSKFTPFAKNKFEYEDGTNGYKTDQKELIEEIKEFINSSKETGVISAKVDVTEPEITKEMVKKNIVPLSYYTTTSSNTDDATSNMRTALKACNGSVIEPGETWSFNGCTGDSNLESNGYLPGGVIADGSLTQGVGGGLCQASSTIYNAALFANMEVVERYNHFWASAYVPAGLDATIDYPNLDLKLKNTTDYQMFIECTADGRKLSCAIYGYQDPSYDDIATYSENYNIVSGESYDTSAYRIYYKDGKEISREKLPSSHYSLSSGHYVQYSDDGTHRTLPDGSTTEKSNPDEEKPTKPKETTSSNTNNNSSSSNSLSSNNSGNSSSSSTSSSKPTSSSSSKPADTGSKPASSSTSSSSNASSGTSSSSGSSSQTPPATQPAPATTPSTDSKPDDGNAEE